jgi:GTPase Era involved in 16S rRNA processing
MQVVIYDTPGMRGAKDYSTRSHAMRVASAWLNLQECDVYALIIDCAEHISRKRLRKCDRYIEGLAKVLGSSEGPDGFEDQWERKPTLLILNKMDLVDRSEYNEVRLCSLGHSPHI